MGQRLYLLDNKFTSLSIHFCGWNIFAKVQLVNQIRLGWLNLEEVKMGQNLPTKTNKRGSQRKLSHGNPSVAPVCIPTIAYCSCGKVPSRDCGFALGRRRRRRLLAKQY
jgi:hypothetical protein